MIITSTANPTIKSLSRLHDRRGRLELGLYLVEGVRLVEEALATGVVPGNIVVAPDLLRATARGRALHDRLIHAGVAEYPVLEVSAVVLRQVAGTESPSGVAASLPRLPLTSLDALPGHAGLVLVLDGIGDPGNAGTILRTADAAGVDGVVALSGCTDLYAPKVVRAGMGAHLRLPLAVDVSPEQFASWAATRGTLVLADAHAAESLYDLDLRAPALLVVGGEAHGATATAALPTVRRASIPMPGAAESLNAGVAAAVMLFEAVRQRRVPG